MPDGLRTRAISVVTALVLVALGYGIGGLFGGCVTVLAVLATRIPAHRAAAAALAAALLGLAAVFTVLPGLPDAAGVTPSFARHRDLAAASALAAGICTMVAIVVAARRERPAASSQQRTSGRRRRPEVTTSLTFVVLGAAAAAVRVVLAPVSLRADLAEIVANLRLGNGYARGVGAAVEATAAHPPLAPLLAAILPGRNQAALVVLSTATVLVTAALGRRLAGWRGMVGCGASAALLPSMWGQQLPEALAALGVVTAVALAWPDRLTAPRSALAGLCLGAAALARPEALVALPIVVAWTVVTRHGSRAPAVACALAAGAVFAPWQLWVHERFDTWAPSTNLGATLVGANADVVRTIPRVGDLAPLGAPPPGAEASVDRRRQNEGVEDLQRPGTAMVAIARVARGWDVWPPSWVVKARQARHASTAGGHAGVVVEGMASIAAVTWTVLHRRRWRELFPLFALPVAFTVISALTFGSRDVRCWTAPFVAVATGLLVVASSSRRSPHGRRRWAGDLMPRPVRRAQAGPHSAR